MTLTPTDERYLRDIDAAFRPVCRDCESTRIQNAVLWEQNELQLEAIRRMRVTIGVNRGFTFRQQCKWFVFGALSALIAALAAVSLVSYLLPRS